MVSLVATNSQQHLPFTVNNLPTSDSLIKFAMFSLKRQINYTVRLALTTRALGFLYRRNYLLIPGIISKKSFPDIRSLTHIHTQTPPEWPCPGRQLWRRVPPLWSSPRLFGIHTPHWILGLHTLQNHTVQVNYNRLYLDALRWFFIDTVCTILRKIPSYVLK